jgi:hypothetical protein
MEPTTEPRIFTVGKQGCYVEMSPNFETSTLDTTGELLKASDTVPFGFAEILKSPTMGYLQESNKGLSRDDVRKKAFREFIELLLTTAKQYEVGHVLLRIIHDGDLFTSWRVEGKYQFFELQHKKKEE